MSRYATAADGGDDDDDDYSSSPSRGEPYRDRSAPRNGFSTRPTSTEPPYPYETPRAAGRRNTVTSRPRHYASSRRIRLDISSESDQQPGDIEEDSDVDFFGDEGRSRVYAFQLARPTRVSSREGGTEDDESEVVEVETRSRTAARPRTVSYVYGSRYTGSGEPDDFHGATLTVMNEPHPVVKPLFRWMHFPWISMDFDDFSDQVTCASGLTTSERHALTDLLNEVRRKHVKSVQVANNRSIRHMDPSCIQRQIPSDGTLKGQTATPRTVTWVCLPYFSLEAYSGLETATGFPAQTLLQAQFARVGKGRDMQQAVCRNKGVPAGWCFHVAQIWCVVLDNSLLFTCCRLPETSLQGDSIQRILRTTQEFPGGKPKMRISVCYRGCVMWSIPLEECHTWLDFVSHFREIWPRKLVFFRQKRLVTAEEWPKIWHIASRANVALDLKIGTGPTPPRKGLLVRPQEEDDPLVTEPAAPAKPSPPAEATLKPKPTPRLGTARSRSPARPSPSFSILTCLDGVTSTSGSLDTSALEKHLTAVHEYLLRKTSFTDRKRYQNCPETSRMALHRDLEERGLDLPPSSQRDLEGQIDVFNAADVIFSFFFPVSVGIPTAGKFWGAVGRLFQNPQTAAPSEYGGEEEYWPQKWLIRDVHSQLRQLAVTLTSFTDIFKHAGKADREKISVPDELLQAWIHLLMGLICLPTDRHKADMLLDDAASLIHEALSDIVMGMSDRTLLKQAVVLPLDLVSLVSLELIKNATPGLPDITETYISYLASIESEIATKPSNRSHERRIHLLDQEVSIIQRTLDSQSEIFATLLQCTKNMSQAPRLTRYYHRDPPVIVTRTRGDDWQDYAGMKRIRGVSRTGESYGRSRVSSPARVAGRGDAEGAHRKLRLTSVQAGWFRQLLAGECSVQLSRMEREFFGIRQQAEQLAETNRNKVDTTKDRQERAIYAFTIVTVVFLPLSAVSSIFGMNTADIRDMRFSQWAYWAAAVPVTAVVIFLGLLFTGELRNLLAWAVVSRTGKDGYGGNGGYDGKERDGLDVELVSRAKDRGEGDTARVHWS